MYLLFYVRRFVSACRLVVIEPIAVSATGRGAGLAAQLLANTQTERRAPHILCFSCQTGEYNVYVSVLCWI